MREYISQEACVLLVMDTAVIGRLWHVSLSDRRCRERDKDKRTGGRGTGKDTLLQVLFHDNSKTGP